jgi:hypothetical protein
MLPLAFVAATATANAQGHVTTPKEFFGHNIGDDYFLPNYDQFVSYLPISITCIRSDSASILCQ